MIIYYTHDYSAAEGESHRLLGSIIGLRTGNKSMADGIPGLMRNTGKYGRPAIEGFPDFSISHSRNTWAVLILDRMSAAEGGNDKTGGICGLDIQYERQADIFSISKRMFEGRDADAVMKAAPLDAQRIFFRIWTRREALIKAAGRSVTDTEAPSVLEDSAEYCGAEWIIKDVTIPGAAGMHAAAVCRRDAAPGPLLIAEYNKNILSAGRSI